MSRVFLRCYASSSRSPSSSRYLARQKKDPFAVGARQQGRGREGRPEGEPYVSRAAHKLLQLDARDGFLTRNPRSRSSSSSKQQRGLTVVDLGAAPGGWTQVALAALSGAQSSKAGGAGGHVFALDLLDLDPRILSHSSAQMSGAESSATALTFLKGDFNNALIRKDLGDAIRAWRSQDHDAELRGGSAFEDESTHVDVILSDMMANTTGNALRDAVLSLDVIQSALDFACAHLVKGRDGYFVAKYFESNDANEFKREELLPRFESIASRKVAASRSESKEMYWVCRGFKG